jgi:hypothetical protein
MQWLLHYVYHKKYLMILSLENCYASGSAESRSNSYCGRIYGTTQRPGAFCSLTWHVMSRTDTRRSGGDPEQVLERIKAGFDAEWISPTDT